MLCSVIESILRESLALWRQTLNQTNQMTSDVVDLVEEFARIW